MRDATAARELARREPPPLDRRLERLVEVERAVFYLDQLGVVSTKQQQSTTLIGLSHSPMVREPATKLFRYTGNPEGHSRLAKMVRTRR